MNIKGEEHSMIETPLFTRICWAQKNLDPVEPKYAIVWQNEIDEPLKIEHPGPRWLAQALAGGILPPIEARLLDKDIPDGEKKNHPYADPIGAMTEEEAMEYLVKLILPNHIWMDKTSNRKKFVICRRDMLPADDTYRGAWRLVA